MDLFLEFDMSLDWIASMLFSAQAFGTCCGEVCQEGIGCGAACAWNICMNVCCSVGRSWQYTDEESLLYPVYFKSLECMFAVV